MWLKMLAARFVGTFLLLGAVGDFRDVEPVTPREDPGAWREPAPGVGLRELGDATGLRIGWAVVPRELRRDAAYRQRVADGHVIVAENAMKWQVIQPAPDRWRFEPGDDLVRFAIAHGQAVRGHTLVWHGGLPTWLREPEEEWTPEALRAVLETYVTTVVGRWRGHIEAWDVVNEAVAGLFRDPLRTTLWRETLGDGYIAETFRLAHAADPGAKLFYNDFRIEAPNRKADRVEALLRGLLADGVPVHGLGLQAHMHFELPDEEALVANLERFAALGLELHLTEIDVAIPGEITVEQRIRQAIAMRRLTRACLRVPACTTMVFWGVDDGRSWVPRFFTGWKAPLLYDSRMERKLSWYGVADALREGRPDRRLPESVLLD